MMSRHRNAFRITGMGGVIVPLRIIKECIAQYLFSHYITVMVTFCRHASITVCRGTTAGTASENQTIFKTILEFQWPF